MKQADNTELTVGEALRWIEKLKKLEGEGAQVVHLKLLLQAERKKVIEEIEKKVGLKMTKHSEKKRILKSNGSISYVLWCISGPKLRNILDQLASTEHEKD